MLRITIHDSADALLLRLEGRLAGPWVRELELCWQTAQSIIRGRLVTVDLGDVDFVDAEGERLLSSMHRQGVKLVAKTPMLTNLVAEITGEPAPVQPPQPPRRKRLHLRLRVLALFLGAMGLTRAGQSLAPNEVIARYLSATRSAESNQRDLLMNVVIQARLPKLHKQGELRALRFTSSVGRVEYRQCASKATARLRKPSSPAI